MNKSMKEHPLAEKGNPAQAIPKFLMNSAYGKTTLKPTKTSAVFVKCSPVGWGCRIH